jgi:hypothetical protein
MATKIRFVKRNGTRTKSVAEKDGVFKDPAILTPTSEAVVK